jgi:hypothetical protein
MNLVGFLKTNFYYFPKEHSLIDVWNEKGDLFSVT